jgi:zinc transport system ATP-binding protein
MNNSDELKSSKENLTKGISLQIYDSNEESIFESSGKWLYPLFEVEDYLHAMAITAEGLFLHDRIAGRAAASLITRMGFRSCFIDTISKPALEVFERFDVECGYNLLVDKIECRTEDLISPEMSMEDVYQMLAQRAGRFQGLDLEIRNLEAGYGTKAVISGLNLSIRAGEQLVVTGDNGAGKSTLMKSLIGVIPVIKGEIILGGINLKRIKTVPSPIGYVNQSVQTADFAITADEVVALGLIGRKLSPSDCSYQIEIAMRRTGCFHLVGRHIHSLSGGEKQRVSLARCLAQKAGLILMDEPSSFLDRESKDDFLDVLSNVISRHMPTVLLVSNDQEWIERLNWPVRTLKDGCICSAGAIEYGTPV